MENKYTKTLEKIIYKIKEQRKLRGFSHEVMATELEMSISAYNKLERMETSLSLERFLKIKDILKIPVTDFFEINNGNIYNQDLKENAIGHYEVQNLHQENKDTLNKLIESLQNQVNLQQNEIIFLRDLLKKNESTNF